VKPLLLAFLAIATLPEATLCRERSTQSPSVAKPETANPSKTEAAKQQPSTQPLSQRVPTARPEDVNSIDSILIAVYDVISGPAGERDWNRFRSLFIPGARLTSAQKNKDGSFFVEDVEGYAQGAGNYFKTHGFYERSIVNRVERFGNVVQVFSSYESRNAPNEKPFARGVNSIQLFTDGSRWWVVSILWDEETPANPLPADLATRSK
jgi:hypothetical protein